MTHLCMGQASGATSAQFAKAVLSTETVTCCSGGGITQLILRLIRNDCVLISSSQADALAAVAEAEVATTEAGSRAVGRGSPKR